MYSYKETVKTDIKGWMDDHSEELEGLDRSGVYETVFEGCWDADEVTGNGSGSYTFSRSEARRNFFEDDDSEEYIYRMCEEGFCTYEEVGKHMAQSDWEWVDVSIRCFLLGTAVDEVIAEMNY